MDAGILIIVAVIIVGLTLRGMSGGMDRTRVEEYIAGQGGKLLDCNWAPFGRGWFGSKEERIYEITYLDRNGNRHRANCKTSLFSGVYFTEDNVEEQAEDRGVPASEETELERLRRENAELKRRLDG